MMILRLGLLPSCLVLIVAAGCNSATPTGKPAQSADTSRPKDLLGKWKLVKVGGKPPDELGYKSLEIDFKPDGTWNSTTVFQMPGFGAPDTFLGHGKWSVDGDQLAYEYDLAAGGMKIAGSGPDSGKVKIRREAGRLTVDPNCFAQVRKKDTDPVAGEYERVK
jgi:hypothetical protein